MEKDLWVCWTLRALFRLPASGLHLTLGCGALAQAKAEKPVSLPHMQAGGREVVLAIGSVLRHRKVAEWGLGKVV